MASISPTKLDFSIFLTFFPLISFSIDDTETNVFFLLSSIICADKLFKDFVTEILYLLGEQHRIVGISRYTVRPEEAKSNHPVVSAFVDGSVKKISELKPDLVIGFSDIQGDLAAKLIKANLQVLIFNHRSIEEILEVILTIGRIVSAED